MIRVEKILMYVKKAVMHQCNINSLGDQFALENECEE